MRLAAASGQSKDCLLHYSGSKLPILSNFDKDVLRGGSAVLEWAVSLQTPFHTVHTVAYPFQTWKVLTLTAPNPSFARGLWEPGVLHAGTQSTP